MLARPRSAWLPWLALSPLLACVSGENICPEGLEPSRPEMTCVPVRAVDAGDAASLDGRQRDVELGDGAAEGGDAARDAADTDAAAADARASAESGPAGDAASLDAADDAGDGAASEDARAEGPETGPAPMCSATQVTTWKAFHEAPGLNAALMDCAVRCDDEDCLMDCAAEAGRLDGCRQCATEEGYCLLDLCWIACGREDLDDACRACLCEAGCTDRFERCAGRSMDTCEDVYGSDPAAGSESPTEPLILRYRSLTGSYMSNAHDEIGPERSLRIHQTYWSVGWTHLVAFEHAGQAYLLQHKSQCGEEPCLARISPVLADGGLGQPVYEDVWSRGWDELEVFPVDDALHLLRFKTGARPTGGPSTGSARVDRLRWEATGQLTLEPVHDGNWSPTRGEAWSSLEAFVLEGTTYLLRYGHNREGEVQVVQVGYGQPDELGLEVVRSARWKEGWDVVRTFPHEGRWFVLRYKSGELFAPNDEPVGTVQVVALELDGGAPRASAPLFQGTWEPGFENVVPFRFEEDGYLLAVHAQAPTDVRVWRLHSAAQWSEELGEVIATGVWGGEEPYDVVTVAPSGRW